MTTLESIQAILKTNFDLSSDVVQPEARLEDLDIDSLAVIEVMFAVEEEFKVTVPSEPAALQGQMETVGDLIAYIDRLVAEQRPLQAGGEVAS
jgi:acyl carrier protein